MACLLIYAAGEKAAIHHEHLSGNEAGRLGSKKNRRADQLFRLAKTFHRSAQQQFLAARSPIEQSRIQCCAKDPRSNGVDADPMLCANSVASDLVKDTTAALLAPYAATS